MRGIYKIWFNDNYTRIYVGQTLQSFSARKNKHLSDLRRKTHKNLYLQNAFNKYGEKNFCFEPIESFIITDPIYATKREMYWYEHFIKQGKIYNLNPPEINHKFKKSVSTITRKKISLAKKGKKLSKNHRQKISQALKGKIRSKEHCQKISIINKGRVHSKEVCLKNSIAKGAKPFYVLKNNEIIAEYTNQRKCAKDFHLDQPNINKCLKQSRQTHKGYTFKYLT